MLAAAYERLGQREKAREAYERGIETAQRHGEVNTSVENIGARRLMTVMERILDEISFEAGDRHGETVTIDGAYVREHIGDLAKNADLSKFIL
jgi:ATP-dependent protease HslVU (ClpYQ) ATPase subunit